jgi:hypothetical protein
MQDASSRGHVDPPSWLPICAHCGCAVPMIELPPGARIAEMVDLSEDQVKKLAALDRRHRNRLAVYGAISTLVCLVAAAASFIHAAQSCGIGR